MSKQNSTPTRGSSQIVDSESKESNIQSVPAQISGLNSKTDAPSLDRLQRWMFNVVIHPAGVRKAIHTSKAQEFYEIVEDELESLIEPSEALSSADRMQIYSNCYTWRLVEVLEEEFPGIRAYLGEDEFYQLAKDYLDQHPSQSYGLQGLGLHFADFLSHRDSLQHHLFLADVATVERALEDVFSKKQETQVSPEELLAVSMDKWPNMSFKCISALELYPLDYPVNKFLTAAKQDETEAMQIPQAKQSYVMVYQKNFVSWRASMSKEQFEVLKALKDGLCLGQALVRCASIDGFNFECFVGQLADTFQE